MPQPSLSFRNHVSDDPQDVARLAQFFKLPATLVLRVIETKGPRRDVVESHLAARVGRRR